MLSTHGEVSFIPNVIYDYGLNRTNANSSFEMEEARNARFKEYGWDSSNFLKLSGRKILIWAALILLYPVVYYLRKKYSDKHKFCEIWRSINQKYEYTLLLRGFIMSYCSMFLAASLNLFKLSFQSLENTITSFVCITGALLLVYLPIQIMNILQSNYSRVKTEKFMLQYSTIIKELDTSRPIRYMYYPVFLLRRAVFAFVLVLFSE
jgi:magnesium-transporting ATPase (P-type)